MTPWDYSREIGRAPGGKRFGSAVAVVSLLRLVIWQ